MKWIHNWPVFYTELEVISVSYTFKSFFYAINSFKNMKTILKSHCPIETSRKKRSILVGIKPCDT